jgi:hypothetical protein
MSNQVGTIFDNVELPKTERAGFGPRTSKYPFAQLEVGQCLRIDEAELPKNKISAIRGAVFQFKKTKAPTSKFAVRQFPDGSGAVGVWRLV